MGVELISVENIGRSSSGNITVTVPALCTAAYVFLGGNYTTSGGSFTATLGGNAQDESIQTGGDTAYTNGGVIAFYDPPTGSQTLALTFAQTLNLGMGGIIAYVKGGVTTGWRDSDIDQQTGTTACSATVNSAESDLVLGLHTRISSYPGVPSGWTQLGSNVFTNSIYGVAASSDSPGASTTTHAGSFPNYAVVSAISIEEEYVPIEGEALFGAGAKAEVGVNFELSVFTSEEAGAQASSDASYGGAVAEFGAGANAESDAAKERDGVAAAGAGANVEADAYTVDCRILGTAWVKAEADALVVTSYAEAEAGASAEADFNFESFPVSSVGVGVAAESDAYNYSEWVRNNLGRANKRFIFILTGAAYGLEDATIPMSSFQARKRSGDPTYLSVSVPSFGYNTEIADRPNGQMVIYAGYEVDGELSLLEELIRADMSEIAPYKGSKNRSVVLTGYRTATFAPKSVTLDKAFYSFIGTGVVQHRFAEVDLFLNPGDTLTVDDVAIVVGSISYTVNTFSQLMQVFEGQ